MADPGGNTGSTTIPEALAGERIDRIVAMITGCSRAEAADAISAGQVRLDRTVTTTRSVRVQQGQVVEIDQDPRRPDELPQPDPSVPLAIVHVDDQVIVIDKAAGQVVHPGAGHSDSTVVSGLLARFPELVDVGEPHRPGIVHRLDKGTSGLMVVARTELAYEHLVGLLSTHDVQRRYRTLVWGLVEADRGTVDAPLGRSRRDPLRMTVATDGRASRTHYEVRARHHRPAEMTSLEVSLETGRTHQIRVHLTSIGHAVVGDPTYGRRSERLGLDRPFLHAAQLSFQHPSTREVPVFTSPLPADLEVALATVT